MKAWIDQAECIGNGICSEISPETIVLIGNIAYMRQNGSVFAASEGNPEGRNGLAAIPEHLEEEVRDAAEECPTECIHIVD